MIKKWYDILIERVKRSYSQQVIVNDQDHLGNGKDLLEVLNTDFAIVGYRGELSLRQFLRQHQNQQILILQQEELVLPFDLVQSSDLMTWELADVFPRLDSLALRRFEIENYQSIFEAYQELAEKIPFQDEEQTLLLLREWIRAGKVLAREKGYGGMPSSTVVKTPMAIQEKGNSDFRAAWLLKEIRRLLSQDKLVWPQIAQLWGELEALHPAEKLGAENYYELDGEISQRIQSFITEEYDTLFFASYKKGPVTINQTMNYLGMLESERTALLCFDGMGFPEWVGLKKYLQANKLSNFQEQATFALVPTLTSSSRTALFSGEVFLDKMGSEATGFVKAVDRYFPEGTSKTKRLFKNTNGKGNKEYLNYDMLGIIFDIIDNAGHKSILFSNSKKNMHHQLQQLYGQTEIAAIISSLLREGYRVFLTADHGSIWCHGNGVKVEKYLVEDRALRALIYPNAKLAEEFAANKDLFLFRSQRILGDKVLVLPQGRKMFSTKDKPGISHGGIHIEELIIPFVEVLP